MISSKFLLPKQTFTQQYASVYFCRLHHFREILEKQVKQLYPQHPHYSLTEEFITIGIVFVESQLKANVLSDLANQLDLSREIKDKMNIFNGEHKIRLENEQGSSFLLFDDEPFLPSGVVVAIRGSMVGSAIRVKEIIYPRCEASKSVKSSPGKAMIVSGLEISNNPKNIMNLDLLTMHLMNDNSITDLIILGNSLAMSAPSVESKRKFGEEVQKFDLNPTELMSLRLSKLSKAVKVHLIPGEFDPTNEMLPQQPFSRHVFDQSAGVIMQTNPFEFTLNGLTFIGESGQSLDDLKRYGSNDITSMEVGEAMLNFNHLAPTSPDTLGCYPFIDDDPFIIRQLPNVLLLGNQEKLEVKQWNDSVKIMVLPRFCDGGEAVVLDLFDMSHKRVSMCCDQVIQ